ncbi:MAG: O-antigen ligase family protein, partial [Thermoanaerobaculia bacterium]
AATSLLQTYGLNIEFFSLTRAPGGTLGNRNFIAHVAAFGFPLLLMAAMQAQRRGAYLRWAIGTALVFTSLVLTRSRAAWLAFAAVVIVIVVSMFFCAALRRDRHTWKRLSGIVVLAAACVALSLLLPNALRWRGNNPYLESMTRITEYSEGSGRGRLVQYGRSLLMAIRHPLFGVGPGNWPVIYPSRVPANDPSLDQTNAGMTSNPWPSSDWIACIAERGVAAFVLLALVFFRLAKRGLRQLRNAIDAQEGLAAAALLGIVAGAIVAGTFDAVLLLAVPAFLVWAALGALWIPDDVQPRRAWSVVVLLAILALPIAGVVRSASQLLAMDIYATHSDRAALVNAARIDPGNYRLRLRLAHMGGRARCENARAAHALLPSARAAVEASRGCGK